MNTTSEVIKHNFEKIAEYLGRAIPVIYNLAHNFKVQPEEEDLEVLRDLFDGIGFIFHTKESIDDMENINEVLSNENVWNEYRNEVKHLDNIVKSKRINIDYAKAKDYLLRYYIKGNPFISK